MSDREPAAETGEPFLIGAWRVDPALDEISSAGRTVKLEPRAMRMLVTLAARAGDVVTPDQLLDAVWPGLVVTQSSIYQTVAQLRKTLGDSAGTPEYIATVPRKGYRLVAPVRPIDETVEPVTAAPPVAAEPPPPTVASPAPAPVVEVRATSRATPSITRRQLLAAASVAGAAGLGWFAWHRTTRPTTEPVAVAVVPFDDRSPGAIEKALADGIAADVIARFERSKTLQVAARESAFRFRGTKRDSGSLDELRKKLNVDFVLFGEVERSRLNVRATVRVIDLKTRQQTWNNVYERPAERLAELPGLIAAGVQRALRVADDAPVGPGSLEAYELVLLANDVLRTQRTQEGIQKARDYYQHAIDTDPTYARAYAGLANTWLSQQDYGFGIDYREAGARAQPLLDKALQLDPACLEALVSQSWLYLNNNWTEAPRARVYAAKAVTLYPGSAASHFALGVSFAYDEQPREALRHYTRAQELDPLSARIANRFGMDTMFSGDYAKAQRQFARAADLAPRDPWLHLGLALLEYAQGSVGGAVVEYRRQLDIDGRRPDALQELGWAYLDLQMPTEAQATFEALSRFSGRDNGAAVDAGFVRVQQRGSALVRYLGALPAGAERRGHVHLRRLVLDAIAGRMPDIATLRALDQATQSDPIPWVGQYWIFHGHCAWLDLALLYRLAGDVPASDRWLDACGTMFERLKSRGNVYHAIDFQQARIAALRGDVDGAITRLTASVDGGSRRAWIVESDPAFAAIRDDRRVAALQERTASLVAEQRRLLA